MRRTMSVLMVICATACGTDPHGVGGSSATSSELAVGADADQTDQVAQPTFAQWKADMMETALPDAGCFEATFPAAGWQKVECATPEQNWEFNMGGVWGDEYAIRDGSDPAFSSAEAFFTTSGLTTTNYYDLAPDGVTHRNNWFSVQINTNHYTSSLCSGGCQGWTQFVYENHSTGGQIAVQEWLVGYGSGACPSGWGHDSTGTACVKTAWGPTVNAHTITILDKITLTGKITHNLFGTKFDGVYLTTNDQNISVTATESTTGLNGQWGYAETNVLGHDGGSGAIFSNGSSIQVETWFDGTSFAPGDGYFSPIFLTGEYNNLNFGTHFVAPQEILFVESR